MRPVVLGLVVLMFAGCATLFQGGPDHIPVSTNPPGATVIVDGIPVGQTPIMVVLDRERNHGVIRIELPGFAPITLVRDKTINGWFWGNLCFGGWGIIIDLIAGNVQGFDDTPIAIGMTPAYGAPGYPQQGYSQEQQGYPQPGYPQQPYPQQPYPQQPYAPPPVQPYPVPAAPAPPAAPYAPAPPAAPYPAPYAPAAPPRPYPAPAAQPYAPPPPR